MVKKAHPKGIGVLPNSGSFVISKNYIGGVILFDETIKQKTSDGQTIPELISENNAIPGIKVDKGAKPLAGSPDETVTEGLDGLRERLKEYYDLGARFTKWRAVYKITYSLPSSQSIKSNAHALARYASLVQEANMVPIVEPEVLMDGEHSADDCLIKTSEVIQKCFEELIIHKIDLTGIILKPNMILAGNNSKNKILFYIILGFLPNDIDRTRSNFRVFPAGAKARCKTSV